MSSRISGLSTGTADTKVIALGIAEALNATVFGLAIAVPTLVAFSYFSRKVEVMSVEMETLVVELITKCYYGRVSSRRRLSRRHQLRPRSNPCRSFGRTSRESRSEGSRHEVRGAKTAGALIIIVSLVDILIDPADLFCRLDHVQKGSAGSAD